MVISHLRGEALTKGQCCGDWLIHLSLAGNTCRVDDDFTGYDAYLSSLYLVREGESREWITRSVPKIKYIKNVRKNHQNETNTISPLILLSRNHFSYHALVTEIQQCHCKRWIKYMADSRLAPSQQETALLCYDVSHWLGARLESAQEYVKTEFVNLTVRLFAWLAL